MIRISTRTGTDGRTRLHVEGRLVASNVEMLADAWRRAVSAAAADGPPVVLDLSGVTYADAAAARWLQRARDSGTATELAGCSGLIRELLRLPAL